MGSPASWAGGLSNQSATATGAAAAETCNAQSGVITTESLSTASGATSTRTLTNSFITANSLIYVSIMGGTNAVYLAVTIAVSAVAAGSCTVKISNLSGSPLAGTVVYSFLVL